MSLHALKNNTNIPRLDYIKVFAELEERVSTEWIRGMKAVCERRAVELKIVDPAKMCSGP